MTDEFKTVDRFAGGEELEHAGNGLKVLLLPDETVPVVAVCVVYHVGSRNEAVGHTGATHLLEHLLFRGSRRFNPDIGRPIARALERVGASFNATTWLDRTNYYETLPGEHLELALELEADRMRWALLRPEDLAAEMTVVRNEFERGENDPFDVLLKESFAMAFREHPYHHPTIGWRSDIENATIERLRAFYDTFYHPSNASLLVVGSYDRAEALDLVARHFGPIPRPDHALPRVVTREPAQQGERRFVVRRTGEVGWVSLSWRTPEAAHADTHALAVLSDILTGGVTGRLHQELVETGRCLDAQAVAWQLRDPGLFQVFATLDPSSSHDEVEAVIRAQLRRIAAEGVSEEELERAKVQVEAATAFQRESPGQIAAALTEAISAVDRRFYFDYPDRIRALAVDDVQRVAATYFDDDAATAGMFVPLDGDGAPRARVPAPGPRPLRPAPCAWRSAVAEHVEAFTLPGGARLWVLPRGASPTVHLHGSLLAGHGMTEAEQWTAATMVPDMLERGTRTHSRLGLARMLEDRGIDLAVANEGFNPLEVVFGGRALSSHTDLFLDLLVEMLRYPTFPADELDKLRQLRLGELAQSREDTFHRAFEAFLQLVFPAGHPWCRRSYEERRAGLESVSAAELEALHRRLYGPASVALVVVGDVQPDRVAGRLQELMAGWVGGAPSPVEVDRLVPAAAPARAVRQHMADKPNVDVVLGHPGGLRRNDDDYVPSILANAVLGQSTLSARLGQRLRDREGLTYGVISRFFGASQIDGPWAATFSVSGADLERGLAAAREEVLRFWEEGPSDDEVEDERQAIAGALRVGLATPAGMARELSRLLRFGLPPDEVDRLPERVLATPTAAVAAAARRHLSPEHLSAAVAGGLVDPVAGGS